MPARDASTMLRYEYAGRELACAIELLPLKASSMPSARPDLVVLTEPDSPQRETIHWLHHWRDDAEETELSLGRTDDGPLLRFPDVADFRLAETGEIVVRRVPGAGARSVEHLLLDQVLPRLLAHRGELVLHASAAITSTGEAILALGPSGSGKSTFAAALAAQSGGGVLADDCVVVSVDGDRLTAMPTYPGLRLWRDSLENLFPSANGCDPVSDHSDKWRIATPAATRARPDGWTVAAVLVLDGDSEAGGSASDDTTPCFFPLSDSRACMTLTANAFQFDIGNAQSVRKLLTLAAAAAARAPVTSLRYPRDYAALPAVAAAILDHFHHSSISASWQPSP